VFRRRPGRTERSERVAFWVHATWAFTGDLARTVVASGDGTETSLTNVFG